MFTKGRIASSGRFEDQKRNSNKKEGQKDPKQQYHRQHCPARNPPISSHRRSLTHAAAGVWYRHSLDPRGRNIELHYDVLGISWALSHFISNSMSNCNQFPLRTLRCRVDTKRSSFSTTTDTQQTLLLLSITDKSEEWAHII